MATQPQSARATGGPPQLYAALLDYHRHPGKYAVARREPAVLFASIRAILQLAAGKSDDERSASLQPAAAFFVRAALTYPGADHYTLLGVERSSDAATIKEHYRLMMRLVHPDFASTVPGAAWPPDAATRLNLAYGTLASPEKRARYDEETTVPPAMPRPSPAAPKAVAVPSNRGETDPRLVVKRLAAGFGAVGALGVVALFVAGGSDRETLIQGDAQVKAAFLAPLLEGKTPEPAPVLLNEHPTSTLHPDARPAPAMPIPVVTTLAAVTAATALPMSAPVDSPRIPPPALPVSVAPPPAPSVPAAKPNPGVTLAEAQPLLTMLLQQVQSGRGEQLLGLLEKDARNAPAARALSRQLDVLADGARDLRLAHVEFRAEPAEGRLYVVGHIKLQPGEAAPSAATAKTLSLRAEFMSRDGLVVMTGLSGLGEN